MRVQRIAMSIILPHGSRHLVGALRLFASTPGTLAPPPCSEITHLTRSPLVLRSLGEGGFPTLKHNSAIRAIAWQWMTSGRHSRSALPSPGTNGLPPFRSSSATTSFGIGHHGYIGLNLTISIPSTVSAYGSFFSHKEHKGHKKVFAIFAFSAAKGFHNAVVAKRRPSCPAAF